MALVDAIVAKVSRTSAEVSGAGTLQPVDEVDLKTEASGRIASLNLQEGRRVEAGALLAKIDDAVLQAQRSKALSQVHRFETIEGRRKQELVLKAVSQQDVDLAEADLEAARADLKLVDAQIRNTEVRAPFAGRLIVSVEREKVFETHSLQVPAGTTQVTLPVKNEWLPNAYVVGLLVRTPDEARRRLPMASFGIVPLKLDTHSRQLSYKWNTRNEVHSQEGIDVDLEVMGGAGAKVVLAAVDEGVLQIVNFSTPDPFAHFYRKRSLGTATWCLFSDVLPDLQGRRSVGGDEDDNPIQHAVSITDQDIINRYLKDKK